MVLITEDLVRKKSEHNECLIGTLEELSLHQEDIEKIENLQNWCRDLKILLLQSNLISKIENLYKLKKLEYLNLAVNCIDRVENLEQLESLNKLDLTLNFIGELTSIESLRGNYNLRQLILTGNPCCDYPHYRDYVIATLPQLNIFDCEEIKQSQKLAAQRHLKKYREIIIQKQADYAIQRDEQKIRVQNQKKELEAKMADLDDEEEQIKLFWSTKSEHCPETRAEIVKYHNRCRGKDKNEDEKPKPKQPQLFAPCGRPYNLNQAKIPFTFKDEDDEYILELEVYKFLDTALINCDIETNYVRVVVKGKIFQISLAEEVKISEATIQRSQLTGHLLIKVPKMHCNETIKAKTPAGTTKKLVGTSNERCTTDLKGPVNINNICTTPNDVPDLI